MNKMFFVLFLFFHMQMVSSVYFSMANLEVTVPSDRRKLPPGNHPVVTLYAQGEGPRYSINGSHGYLQVYPTTGDVLFTSQFLQNDIKGLGQISSWVSVKDSSTESDTTSLQVNVFPLEPLDCDLILEDLCYWTKIKYRVKEATKPTIIGTLASQYVAEICPTYKLNYSIQTGSNEFKLVPPTDINKFWTLATAVPFYRDIHDQQAVVQIKCTVENKEGSVREINRGVFVEILDEDNNAPVPQDKEIHVQMDTNFVNKGYRVEHNHLIFTDKDTPDVNHYEANILSNDPNLLLVKCKKYPDTRDGLNQTAIHCKLTFTENKHFMNSSYDVVLQLNDTTLKNANVSGVARLPIHFYFGGSPANLIKFNRSLNLYPDREIKIFRSAAPLARITQPKDFKGCSDFKVYELNTLNGTTNEVARNKKRAQAEGIFNITPDEGILFVHDVKRLRSAFEYIRLNITWKKHNKTNYDEIQVRIVNEPTVTCATTGPSISEWSFCSEFQTYNACIKPTACAISTGGAYSVQHRIIPQRCMWRGEKNPSNNGTTHLYSTCTPDTSTCPNGICDSLEKLNYLICPQDCTDIVHFPTKINSKTGRGIDVASGICFCDQTGGCYCNMPSPQKKKDRGKKFESSQTTTSIPVVSPNVSKRTANSTSKILGIELAKCGTSCVLGIVAGTLFLGGAVALIVICWRLDRVHKAVREKYNDDNQDMVAPLSDYVDRNLNSSEPLPLNFHMTTSLADATCALKIIKKYEPDPKWEFPRSQLIIEQTLGEGEFGRVLRAKALDIAGQTGYTTVAVKTLKEDARDSELSDLLSEYQLLKEVSHPNVIRLLGVCTVPNAPVYLIIEFAEHGSLRNYLRRSRHLKSENQRLPSSSEGIEETEVHYDEPNVSKITSKEILSFAWQICNGMTYLSDIKLVHRDLAARNVLLAADKICKISDFGLTRDIYEDNAYFKRSKGRVPVKWMAPESLADHIYTTKSDVWSFGILVWELLTLGATPYPGIAVQNLFHLLRQGYRMERPDNCSPELYKIMRGCWHIDPEQRPSFQELASYWEKMLGDGIEYLDLTNNAIHNRSYFCSPFEENLEPSKPNGNPLNYLSKSQSYEKCGASEKLLNDGINPLEDIEIDIDKNRNHNPQGYETPIKHTKKIMETPTNDKEGFQLEYTDMESGKAK